MFRGCMPYHSLGLDSSCRRNNTKDRQLAVNVQCSDGMGCKVDGHMRSWRARRYSEKFPLFAIYLARVYHLIYF